jgi:hypothetical protein
MTYVLGGGGVVYLRMRESCVAMFLPLCSRAQESHGAQFSTVSALDLSSEEGR